LNIIITKDDSEEESGSEKSDSESDSEDSKSGSDSDSSKSGSDSSKSSDSDSSKSDSESESEEGEETIKFLPKLSSTNFKFSKGNKVALYTLSNTWVRI
jgi:hypothetical protein